MLSSEFPPVVGGIASHVHELSATLVKLGHNVAVVSRRRDNALAHEQMDGIEVYRPNLMGNRLIYQWQLRRFIKKKLAVSGFDVVHVHGIRPLVSSKGLDLPVCFTNHSSGFLNRLNATQKDKKSIRERMAHCAAVIAPSRELVEATKTIGYHGPVSYISNAVDAGKFCPGPGELRQRLKIPDEALCVVLSRRLVEKNGVLYFARAIAELDRPDCYFIVAGDGNQREQFEAEIRGKPVWPRVRMLGRIPNDQMASVYRAGQLLVLPSLMEATSISGLEGMACGLAVLGTRVGGIPEIVEEGVTGYLVPAADATALRQALVKCLDSKDVLKEMGQRGLERVQNEFTWEVVAAKTLSVYETATGITGPRN